MTTDKFVCSVFLYVAAAFPYSDANAQVTILNPQRLAFSRDLTVSGYDYAPTIIFDGEYHMYWCGSRPPFGGDHIFHARALSVLGPWTSRDSRTPNTFDVVFGPTWGEPSTFDRDHTCDPSIIRFGDSMYMYYGGLDQRNWPEHKTALGVARLQNSQWVRLNGGRPILRSWEHPVANVYGTGQPSAVVLNGYIYLIYSDTFGLASNPYNGGGQYVLRSRDPLFMKGVEALTSSGFQPLPDQNPATPESQTRYSIRTRYSLMDAASVDWQYSDMLQGFLIAVNGYPDRTSLYQWDLSGAPRQLNQEWVIPGTWVDGPGVVRRPDGHSMPSATCGTVPIEILHAAGTDSVWTAQIHATRAEMKLPVSCGSSTWSGVLESWLVGSPGLPLMLVVDGKRLQFQSAQPAVTLSRNSITVSSSIYHAVPYGASMYLKADVYGASGRPAGFVLDGNRLWPVSCVQTITANGSRIRTISTKSWDSYPLGPSLYCVQ